MTDDMLDDLVPEEAVSDDALTHSDYRPGGNSDAENSHNLSGMYQNWFLDYASYVILERAVPHIEDGLKPVQRRIMHSMRRMDDGRYNKVANIVGHTMHFHPHGNASIGDALVQLGQKELLVDTQGNWGNILTGDRAAAPRYIEARLSKFAQETVFNPKTTEWQLSYDGRNKEPITLPVKYPLLLAQGAEGIAVGLSSKILPHNFTEICDAAIAFLKNKPFNLYPDFPTGGSIDVSKYNDGHRGGSVKVRAKIEKIDNKTLVIREIPYSKTTTSLIESILKAIEKGKIKARKVDDNTAAEVEIVIHLAPGVSSDKTIDALYAFSDCEINLSPNCCVIQDHKPMFLTVTDVLKHNVRKTTQLLKTELEIRKGELLDQLFFASLEKIFIEERIYKDAKFENATSQELIIKHIDKRLEPYKKDFVRPIKTGDILRLLEIKMQRIAKFNKERADELMARIQDEIADIQEQLEHMTEVTIKWYKMLKDKYISEHPRKTEIRNFDTIEAAKVAEANEKLYINREEGFVGTGLKKDEFICNCSDIDDIIIFYNTGKYKVIKVAEKIFVGKDILHVQVYKRNDKRTIYNTVYRDGKNGIYYIKRFNVPGVTREREYDLTQGKPQSKVIYFTANSNGEAEIIKVTLEPKKNLKRIFFEEDFSQINIKSRSAKGNILTKLPVFKIGLKTKGQSTLGGRKVWWDKDVNRINYQEHGEFLGEFGSDDAILVVLDDGNFYISNFDANNHYEDNISIIQKWEPEKIWTCVFYDHEKKHHYIKRFHMEAIKSYRNFIGENPKNKSVILTDQKQPNIQIQFGGADHFRNDEVINAEQFISVKGFKAKGKRISTYQIQKAILLPPLQEEEPEEETNDTQELNPSEHITENLDPDQNKSKQQIIDEITGQLRLFDD